MRGVFFIFLFFTFVSLSQDKDLEILHQSVLDAVKSENPDELTKLCFGLKEGEEMLKNPPKGIPLPPPDQLESVLEMFKKLDKLNKERPSIFFTRLKERKFSVNKLTLEKFNKKMPARNTPMGKMYIRPELKFVCPDTKKAFVLVPESVMVKNGKVIFMQGFPDSFRTVNIDYPKVKNEKLNIIGCMSKEDSIQTSADSFLTITTTSYGSAVMEMIAVSCCVDGFKKKYYEIDFEEKHLKGGFVGLPWNKFDKLGLDLKKITYKSSKEISPMEISATFKSGSMEIVAPMKLENGRRLFTLGKAHVYKVKDDNKREEVDLNKLIEQ